VSVAALTFLTVALPGVAHAQGTLPNAGADCQAGMSHITPLKGTLERITVHGEALVGNLEGDSPDRCVSVYLPPSYAASPDRRYPVVYILHGYTDDDQHWMGWTKHFVDVPSAMEKDLAAGTTREMILVMANAYTLYQGSMYSSSVTTGDWETFISEDLVSYIDSHFRTLARRDSRGLAGHSMGGYGAIRIGMKRPDVFSADYVMSPCCMPPVVTVDPRSAALAEAVKEPAAAAKVPFPTRALLAEAAAWSPDPQNPPLYFDLPTKDGDVQRGVLAAWAANAPLAMVFQYVANLKKLRALAIDAGEQDVGIAAASRQLDLILRRFGVPHSFEIYDPGTHISRIEERVEQDVLPFFSKNLEF
jgi:S-formylglutathione hydrolase FrmB